MACQIYTQYAKYTHDDKVLIRHYRQTENCGAMKMCRKFENKGWTLSGVDRILKNMDEEDSKSGKMTSGRLRPVRTQANIGEVRERV